MKTCDLVSGETDKNHLDIALVLLSARIEVILDTVVPALLDDLLGLLPREEQVPDEGEGPVQVVLVVLVVFCACCVPPLVWIQFQRNSQALMVKIVLGLIRIDGRIESLKMDADLQARNIGAHLYGWGGPTLDIEVGLGEAEEDLDDVARAGSTSLSSSCSASK